MRISSLVLAAAFSAFSSINLEAQTPEAVQVLKDVQFLASDSLRGRMTGSPGADTASAYLARRFAGLGLDSTAFGWYQVFTVAADAPALAHAGIGGLHGRNVIAILPGRDDALRRQVIVVGAHYDHLGLGNFGSLDPDSTGRIHNGADDNASGSAALLQIAARLARARPARTVVFIGFSGEELGLLGSDYYVRHPIFPMDSTVAMLNLDMVGRPRGRIMVTGLDATPTLHDELNAAATAVPALEVRRFQEGAGVGSSDDTSFALKRIPSIGFFSGFHSDYHRPTDDWQLIEPAGAAGVATLAFELASRISVGSERPEYVAPVPAAHGPGGDPGAVGGYGPYFGSVPDFGEQESGVKFAEVRETSPAGRAGLRGGDVMVSFDGKPVKTLFDFTFLLRQKKPGDEVEVTVMRNGQPLSVKVVLTTRP